MILREIQADERKAFNEVAGHPLQSWEWGEFKKKEGATVVRLGFFEEGKLQKVLQVFFHKIPTSSSTIGYLPKGYMPDEDQLSALKQLGLKYKAVAVKLEPNVALPIGSPSGFDQIKQFLLENDCKEGRALFTKYTFILSLEPTEEKLFESFKNKTRYNIRLAEKKGVVIRENTSKEGMDTYIEILKETTQRQGFYAHTPKYFKEMWEELGDTGMLKIFEAVYDGQVLTSWIMFVFQGTLYYPYGSSRNIYRELMANNLMMWDMIVFGKSLGLRSFDMWGSLGPDPDTKDPWYGFHRFKQGYSGQLSEFIGTYDYVINAPMYTLYRLAESARWSFLRTKSKIARLIPSK